MLRHAIAPLGRYTKASHDIVRHPRLNSDAKILLLYVQGLPEDQTGKALSDHARKVGITGSAYKTAKKQLVTHGFVHDLKEPVGRGRWVTVQVCSNVPLTSEDVAGLRGEPSPGARFPAVGEPSGRAVGGLPPVDEELDKKSPHPPPEAEAEAGAGTGAGAGAGSGPGGEPSPEVVQGERVLLSLRHERRELHLGVREARGLAEAAAEWLRRGVSAADLRRALVSGLPEGGVRSAVGFLRHRLVHKLPEAAPYAEFGPPDPVAELIPCAGPGDEHVFRSVGGETHCGPCVREETHAVRAALRDEVAAQPGPLPWRERFAAVAAMGGASASTA